MKINVEQAITTINNMQIKHYIKTAYTGITTNKSRSLLTILGIVIGITAIIMVMSVGQGAQNLILSQIEGLGARTVIVEPQARSGGGFISLPTNSLVERDIEAIQKPSNVRGVSRVVPMAMHNTTISYQGEVVRKNILGSNSFIADVLDVYPDQGEMFGEYDVDQKTRVVVLGYKVKDSLFGQSDAVGNSIRIQNQTFRVIGVLPQKGQVSMFNADDMILMPYSALQQYITGTSHFDTLMVQAESETIVDRVSSDITATLLEMHDIENEKDADFSITTQAEAMDQVSTITNILTVLLVSVAAISLVVGGIGIMNIMLVSVTERTREIGLRKALGATEDDILNQFLFECIMLTGLGGVVGIVLGTLLSFLISLALSAFVAEGWTFSFPFLAAFIGITVSAGIGLAFGIYPARQAARKSPMEALRSE